MKLSSQRPFWDAVRYPLRLHKALCWDPGCSVIPLGSWQSTDLGAKSSLKTIAMDLGLLRLLRCCSLHFSLVASGVVGLQHGKQSEDIPTDLEWCRGRIMECHGFCNCIPIRRHIWRETRKVTRCLKIPWNKDEWMAKKRIANKTNKDE